jgi:hypothetical protein
MRRAKEQPQRKDLLASGHASASYGNSSIKTTQSEWERIFGPPEVKPLKCAQCRRKLENCRCPQEI